MSTVSHYLYGPSLALLTDLYQITMAYGYWKQGRERDEAVFHLSFRRLPFSGGYAVAAGLAPAAQYLQSLRFTEEDVAYLATLTGNDGKGLFEKAFLKYLQAWRLDLDIDAMPEGTPCFAHEPLIRVKGPLIGAQLLETALLNIIGANTLFATKAARIVHAAGGEPVLEFGLRRAQGIDGGLTASRAAYLGGCAATSNVLAGRLFGIPVGGTHAHSWVMSFESEMEAFLAYAEALPNNGVFLVDTYDTLQGVRHAVEAGEALRRQGHKLGGIRLDSGNLSWLSQQARRILDEGGFPEAQIYASSDLDERTIQSLKLQDSRITVWGVGTRLVTAYDQPALGGVYKLSALKKTGGSWEDRIKLSEQPEKTSIPGILQVRRFRCDGEYAGDMIFDERTPPEGDAEYVHPTDYTRRNRFAHDTPYEDLLTPVFRGGRLVGPLPGLEDARTRAREELDRFHQGIKRFDYPHEYPAGIERTLYERRLEMILAARGAAKDLQVNS